jgi:hypothetical protein
MMTMMMFTNLLPKSRPVRLLRNSPPPQKNSGISSFKSAGFDRQEVNILPVYTYIFICIHIYISYKGDMYRYM